MLNLKGIAAAALLPLLRRESRERRELQWWLDWTQSASRHFVMSSRHEYSPLPPCACCCQWCPILDTTKKQITSVVNALGLNRITTASNMWLLWEFLFPLIRTAAELIPSFVWQVWKDKENSKSFCFLSLADFTARRRRGQITRKTLFAKQTL